MDNVIAFRRSGGSDGRARGSRDGVRRDVRFIPRNEVGRKSRLFAQWRINASDGALECSWRLAEAELQSDVGDRLSSRRAA